jgi:hypothetical protein
MPDEGSRTATIAAPPTIVRGKDCRSTDCLSLADEMTIMTTVMTTVMMMMRMTTTMVTVMTTTVMMMASVRVVVQKVSWEEEVDQV